MTFLKHFSQSQFYIQSYITQQVIIIVSANYINIFNITGICNYFFLYFKLFHLRHINKHKCNRYNCE